MPTTFKNNALHGHKDPKVLTPEDSYNLALETLKDYERKWAAYKEREARLLNNM